MKTLLMATAALGGLMLLSGNALAASQAYWGCMGSQPAPEPVYDPGPPPPGFGDDGWMNACASKYGSFRWDGPHAGQFKGFDGYWHWCNL